MKPPPAKILAATLLLSLGLAACGSVPTRLFSLQSIPAGNAPVQYSGPPVRVEAVHIPPALDRSEITSDVGDGELKVDDQYHWSAPVTQLVRQTLTVDLMSRLPPGGVLFPHLSRAQATVGLSVDILVFDAGPSGSRLEASWLLSSATEAHDRPKTAVLQAHEPSIGPAATARALSVLIAQLADLIVADLAAAVPE